MQVRDSFDNISGVVLYRREKLSIFNFSTNFFRTSFFSALCFLLNFSLFVICRATKSRATDLGIILSVAGAFLRLSVSGDFFFLLFLLQIG